jgi:class 3 adenylate cyclase/tetratricopeptide (TPR) repeat protein
MADERTQVSAPSEILIPYVPRAVTEWLAEDPETTSKEEAGSLVFVDISGFTALTERLARQGKQGAETLTEAIDSTFAQLLGVGYEEGGRLIKFGGDALLLLFTSERHEWRACRAAFGMRKRLRSIGRLDVYGGAVTLRLSVGVHSGRFDLFLVGDAHRELLIAGPAASETVRMEATADPGEIVVSGATAVALPPGVVGEPKGDGFLLRREPPATGHRVDLERPDIGALDLSVAVPPAIRNHLLAGGEGAEHRRAVVAFVHFDGVDDLTRSRGRDAIREALEQIVCTAQEASARRGVTFLGSDIDHDGGKLILVGGVPTATGEDEDRVLLALRDVIEAPTNLTVRAGANAGHVFAGDVGPWYRRTYTIMGDTVNLAARLMAHAEPGQILATESVLGRARTAFDLTPLPPFTAKGKSRPVEAQAVGSVLEAQADQAHETRVALIGRRSEMAALERAVWDALAGRGRVIELVGDPGIGKSRLAAEVRSMADEFVVLQATCRQYETDTPYALLRRLVPQLLGLAPEEASLAATRVRERLQGNAPEMLPWIPLLGAVLDVGIPATPEVASLDEEFRAVRLGELIVSLFSEALPTSALLIVEDTQWLDDSSGHLMARVAARAKDRPWVLVATRRHTEGRTSSLAGALPTIVSIGPLSTDESLEFVEVVSEDAPLSPHDAEEAARRSGGNPLLLQELVLAAREVGGLRGLPDSAEALITARIDRLSPTERTILRHASVLGVEFDAAHLGGLLEHQGHVRDDAIWHRLRGFLWRRGGRAGFHQTLARDVAYGGLPFRTRKNLHTRIGEAIHRASRGNVNERAEELAFHYFEGQCYEEAWRFARLAGDRARAKSAHVEAARFYERAIHSSRHITGCSLEELGDVFESLGDVRELLGEFGGAERAFRQGKRLHRGQAIAEARIQLKQAWIAERMARYPTALRRISFGLRILADRDDPKAMELKAQLTVAYAAILQTKGRHREAIRWCRRGIALAEAADDRVALAHAYSILDWALVSQGRSEANEYSWKALHIYEDLGDLGRQALLLNNLGAFAYFRGRWGEALELYERGRDARQRTGDAVNAAYGTFNVGEILADQGRLDDAEPLLRQALRIWRAAGHRAMVALALGQLGRVASRAGRFDQALELFDQASVEFLEIGDRAGLLETNARIAECRLFQGEPSEALSLADEALILAESMGGVNVQLPMLHRIRGEALVLLGDAEHGREALEESLRMGRVRGADYEVGLTLRALSMAARLRGDGAEELEEQASSILEALGVVAVPGSPDRPARPRLPVEASAG